MFASALSALSDRLDSKFLTAYWLPAFVAVLGAFGILAAVVGREATEAWVFGLDSVAQTLFALIVLLAMTMVAFILRAVSRPVVEVFAGHTLPRQAARWSARSQRRKQALADAMAASPTVTDETSTQQVALQLGRMYPLDAASVQPTLFGNILATAVEHPRLAYTMEGMVWWPRLAPLVPAYFQDMLGGAQAPMMALLNLAVVCVGLALSGGVILALIAGQWLLALAVLVAGLLLARLCYNAAVSQAAEVRSPGLRRVRPLPARDPAPDGPEVPTDPEEERALWTRLTQETLAIPRPPTASEKDS
ncbi:MAG: hypothetical protein R2853_19250 [Thermomicrobiales bacterium]